MKMMLNGFILLFATSSGTFIGAAALNIKEVKTDALLSSAAQNKVEKTMTTTKSRFTTLFEKKIKDNGINRNVIQVADNELRDVLGGSFSTIGGEFENLAGDFGPPGGESTFIGGSSTFSDGQRSITDALQINRYLTSWWDSKILDPDNMCGSGDNQIGRKNKNKGIGEIKCRGTNCGTREIKVKYEGIECDGWGNGTEECALLWNWPLAYNRPLFNPTTEVSYEVPMQDPINYDGLGYYRPYKLFDPLYDNNPLAYDDTYDGYDSVVRKYIHEKFSSYKYRWNEYNTPRVDFDGVYRKGYSEGLTRICSNLCCQYGQGKTDRFRYNWYDDKLGRDRHNLCFWGICAGCPECAVECTPGDTSAPCAR